MTWMKNTKNKPDAMLTLSMVSLGLVWLKFLLSDMTIGPVMFGQLDGMVITSILAPTLGAYVARRYNDSSKDKDNNNDQQT